MALHQSTARLDLYSNSIQQWDISATETLQGPTEAHTAVAVYNGVAALFSSRLSDPH